MAILNINDLHSDSLLKELRSVFDRIETITLDDLIKSISEDVKNSHYSNKPVKYSLKLSDIEDLKRHLGPIVSKFNRTRNFIDNAFRELKIDKINSELIILRGCLEDISSVFTDVDLVNKQFELVEKSLRLCLDINNHNTLKSIPLLSQKIYTIDEQFQLINTKQSQLSKSLNDITISIDRKFEEMRALVIEDLNKSLNSIRKTNKVESDALFNNMKSSMDEILSQYKFEYKLMTDSFEEQITTATDSMSKQVDSINHRANECDKEFTFAMQRLEDNIRSEVKGFANQKNKLVNLVGSLSALSRAKEDLHRAKIEADKADVFRLVGIGLMILPLVMFVILFLKQTDAGFELNFTHDAFGMIGKFFSILLFSSPFIYLLKESAYHRRIELKYRTRGIQLASFDGFIEDLDIESKKKIKDDLASHFFGSEEVIVNTGNIPNTLQEIKELISSIKVN